MNCTFTAAGAGFRVSGPFLRGVGLRGGWLVAHDFLMFALRLACRTVAGAVAVPSVADALFPDATSLAVLDSSLTTSAPYARTCSIICPGGKFAGPLGLSLRHWVHGKGSVAGDYDVSGEGPMAELVRGAITSIRAGRGTFYDVLRAGLSPRLMRDGVEGEETSHAPSEFSLGWVGAFGYELKHHSEMVQQSPTAVANPHVSELPDAALLWADRAIVVDHERGEMTVMYLMPVARQGAERGHQAAPDIAPYMAENMAQARATQEEWADCTVAQLEELVASDVSGNSHVSEVSGDPNALDTAPGGNRTPLRFRFDQGHDDYLASIRQAQEFIAAGDSYEVCLTNTAEGPALHDPWQVYRTLRATSPVPYGSYLRFDDIHVLSASPERFLSISEAGRLSAKPIKGTRPRSGMGRDADWWRRDLQESQKDRAENLMIVDLLRNDLSMVAAAGTVQVTRLFGIESYSHVHQMVSTIEAQLALGKTAVDALEVAFPGGSMTGAPKVRTMELIEGLERRARGLYSGAIGWLGLGGAADLAIVIRTLVADARVTTFGVGGAIVADSDPEAEWQETLVKASALLETLGAELDG